MVATTASHPLRYAPPDPQRRAPASSVFALAAAPVAFAFLGLAALVARLPGPWRLPIGGRESATLLLAACSAALALSATITAAVGWGSRRRNVLSALAAALSVLYWVALLLGAVVAGALK